MRRLTMFVSVLALVLVAMVALGRHGQGSLAQDATPATAGHPIVDSWRLETGFAPSVVTFHADGTYFEADAEGGVGVGAWEATGERTVSLTIEFPDAEGGEIVTSKVRASIDVAADGQTFTATYTLEIILPDGTSTGEYGPGMGLGTRIAVEPMGTPAGTFEDLFALLGEQPTSLVTTDLEAYDFGWRTAYEPGPSVTVTVAPGDTIEVANVGAASHNLAVEALGINVDLPPGEATTVTIPADAAPGEYEFICNVPGHAAAGMVGTLIVE